LGGIELASLARELALAAILAVVKTIYSGTKEKISE